MLSHYKKSRGTSLKVQWLRLGLPMQAVRGPSLPGWDAGLPMQAVRGPSLPKIPHALWPKKQNRDNIVTNSIKTLKVIHIRKETKKFFCCFLIYKKKEEKQEQKLLTQKPLGRTEVDRIANCEQWEDCTLMF